MFSHHLKQKVLPRKKIAIQLFYWSYILSIFPLCFRFIFQISILLNYSFILFLKNVKLICSDLRFKTKIIKFNSKYKIGMRAKFWLPEYRNKIRREKIKKKKRKIYFNLGEIKSKRKSLLLDVDWRLFLLVAIYYVCICIFAI